MIKRFFKGCYPLAKLIISFISHLSSINKTSIPGEIILIIPISFLTKNSMRGRLREDAFYKGIQ